MTTAFMVVCQSHGVHPTFLWALGQGVKTTGTMFFFRISTRYIRHTKISGLEKAWSVSLEFGNHIKKMFRKYFGCTDAWDSLLGPELAKEPFWIVAPDQATKSIAYKLNFWNFCHVFLLIILWFLLFVTTFTVKWSNLDQRINSWKYQQWEEDQTFLTWVMNANSPSILRKATLQDHNKQPSCWNPLEPSGLKRCQFERWGTGMKWDQASSKKILPLDPKTMKNEGFIYTPKIWVITPKNEGWGSLYIFCFAGSSWRSASKVLYRRPKRDPTECGDGPGDGPAICLARHMRKLWHRSVRGIFCVQYAFPGSSCLHNDKLKWYATFKGPRVDWNILTREQNCFGDFGDRDLLGILILDVFGSDFGGLLQIRVDVTKKRV